jgi:type II secretory pathway component PulM
MNLSLNSMSERERRLVYLCSGVAVLVLIFAVVLPLEKSVSATHHRVEQKTTDLAWMRGVAPQLAALGPGPLTVANKNSLLVVIDQSAREANLGSSMTGSSPSGAGGLRVRFEKAPFDTLIAWLARMSEQQGIRVDSAQIDDAGKPGLVNASLVLSTR